MVAVVNELAPMVKHLNAIIQTPIPQYVKHKLNERKRLQRSNKTFTTTEKTDRIKILNKEIKSYFHVKKKSFFQCKVVCKFELRGNQTINSEWRSVNM